METTSNILTIKEVAAILRCSKAHALNVIDGKVRGLPKLTHLISAAARSFEKTGWTNGWKRIKPARMTACQSASSWTQEGISFMRRKRYQKGSVRPRKHGKTKVWVGQWWEDGHKRSKVLGRVSEMGKGEAEAMMAVILKRTNEDAGKCRSRCTHSAFTWKRSSCRCVIGNGRSQHE